MPILACMGMALLIYFLLSENIASREVEKIKCSKCKHEIDSSYEFCPKCQEKLKESCRKCNSKIDTNWRYCPYCGNIKKSR
ncbi:Double zinc ribbon [Clostridium formicaceticum]|uniref:Double zinc ribbon n=2 Tax=Clostridium formicaceticum TaxID=1497 RepID=A0AAC9RNF2_9CLOT|nr:hypothetical protein BJL90_01855 [Clostridium formicaceticum]ARE89201.1 Double zinc ribbon [Clostridium formicaceticum]